MRLKRSELPSGELKDSLIDNVHNAPRSIGLLMDEMKALFMRYGISEFMPDSDRGVFYWNTSGLHISGYKIVGGARIPDLEIVDEPDPLLEEILKPESRWKSMVMDLKA